MTAAFEDSGTAKPLQKLLKRAGAEDPAALAKQTMQLHSAALGESPAEGKLSAAQDALVAARKALRDNSAAMRSLVVHLVSLASQHFPELLGHEDVQKFMGSDGLQTDRRRLADYEDVRPLVNGRNDTLPFLEADASSVAFHISHFVS